MKPQSVMSSGQAVPTSGQSVTSNNNTPLQTSKDGVSPQGPSEAVSPSRDARLHPVQHRPSVVNPSTSRVNGIGMWRSWTRSFNTPLLAFLDLFDNAIDASLATGPRAQPNGFRHEAEQAPSIHANTDDYARTGIVLRNSSKFPIPPVRNVLEVYRSSKENLSIGENGIGVKHACANLSDLSFILTRNPDSYGIGVLAQQLQQVEGCVLPSSQLSANRGLFEQLNHLAKTQSHTFGVAFKAYGDGDLQMGLDMLHRHYEEITTGRYWRDYDHVFCVILHKLRHGSGGKNNEASVGEDTNEPDNNKHRARSLLHELAEELPRVYIHTGMFKIHINGKQVPSLYWERRLIELTRFDIPVEAENPWHASDVWKNPPGAIKLRVFCGFDPFRASNHSKSSPLALYIYSRESGRLIKQINDARGELGLVQGGTDFCQGLTIILDDYYGTLPLNPTKQDLAFGLEAHGQVHKANLMDWTGGVAHMYWSYHLDKFGLKAEITKKVADLFDECLELSEASAEEIHRRGMRPLSTGEFTTFKDVKWRNSMNKIRCTKSSRSHTLKIQGRDTLVSLVPPRKPHESDFSKSRKRKLTTSDSLSVSRAPKAMLKRQLSQLSSVTSGSEGNREVVVPRRVGRPPSGNGVSASGPTERESNRAINSNAALHDQINRLKERLRHQEVTIAKFYSSKRENEARIREVEEENKKLETKVKELPQSQSTEWREEYLELRQLLKKRDERIANLEGQLEAAQQKELDSILDEESQKRFQQLTESNKKLRKSLMSVKENAQMLSDQADQNQEQIDTMNQLLSKMESEKKALRDHIKKLQARYIDV